MRKINFNKACRSCLSERGHLRDIFSTKIPRMMENCAGIQVSEGDDLPPGVCLTCFQLIAKFYAFKKKMERSDRVLRNYVKQKKIKQKDILDIAVSEAQLRDEDHEGGEDAQQQKESRGLRKSKIKANKVIDEIINEEKEDEVVDSGASSHLQQFPNEPPPLVPLEPFKKLGYSPSSVHLPDNTPPLIPIKPAPDALLENPMEPALSCNVCSQECSSLHELNEHKTTCKDSFKCNICHKDFKERKRLIGHLKGHMVQKDYGCKICGKRYPNPSTFRVHMRTHTGERPFKCQICNKGFVRWAGVVGHMRTHQPHKPYKCDTCGKCFKISSNLERHKVLHADSLPFCCNYCGKTFSQSDNLQLHIRTYHTNERPYLCNECGKGFVSSTRLNRHMWVHTGYKPYRCKTCPKAYSNSNDLKNHERNHFGGGSEDDKPYACKTCDMRFYHPCRLNKHMKTHERPFSCTICFKSFSTSALLNKHISGKKSMHFVKLDDAGQDNDVEHIFLEY